MPIIPTFETRESFMEAVQPLQEGYEPAGDVTAHTRHIDVTITVGPSGVGKDTLMKLTGLPSIVSDTTRGPRLNDDVMEQHGEDYFFRGEELDAVYADIVNGRYVQWAPGPNNNIYGSRNEAYPDEGPALIDVVADAVLKMRELAPYFHSVESAYVVAKNYEDWIDRLDGRGQLKPSERRSRLEEAYDSLHFGIEDDAMHFILNNDADEAARNLKLLAERNEDFAIEAVARNCGHAMLRGLSRELGLPVVISVS